MQKFCMWEKCISMENMDSSIHGVQTTQKPSEENKCESLLHTLHLCKLHLNQKCNTQNTKTLEYWAKTREIFKNNLEKLKPLYAQHKTRGFKKTDNSKNIKKLGIVD